MVKYKFNAVSNPGPLATMKGKPAANFFGGRYSMEVLAEDRIYYRVGAKDRPLGQWFTKEPVKSVAQARIDLAIKEQWVNPVPGELDGISILDSIYKVKIPKGTIVYEGPIGYQEGVYMGGMNFAQMFIPEPWKISGVEVIGQIPLK